MNAIPYRRSAFQVSLLSVATGGLYVFWWAFWARRWSSATLEREDQPLWKTIALIVPIFNLFLIFEIGQRIEGAAWRANLSAGSKPLGLLGLAYFVISVMWRLPDPYWLICLLSFIPLGILQLVLVRAAVVLQGPAAAPTRFHWVEWVVIVLGCVLWVLAFLASVLPNPDGTSSPAPWFPALVAVATVVALILFARAGRGLVATSEEAA